MPPKSKTIEIDEIVTPGAAQDNDSFTRRKASTSTQPEFNPENPFSDIEKSLPWKARWTLRLTRWFMLLRSKSWGKWLIVPAIALGLLLALPLGLLAILWLIIRSFLRSLGSPR